DTGHAAATVSPSDANDRTRVTTTAARRPAMGKDSSMILDRSYRHPTSIASIVLALGTTSLFAAPPERADEATGERLARYRQYELRLPQDGAGLVRLESGWRASDGNGNEIPLDYLGFLIKPATATRPAVVLVGTREISLESTRSKVVAVDPNPALAKD